MIIILPRIKYIYVAFIHYLEDSEFELGERVLLRILGLGDDDLLCGLTERLRILGDLLRGLADLFLGLGDLLRGLADRLRGLGDRLRTVGECLRGLGERFLEEPLRLLSSSFFGDLPLDLMKFFIYINMVKKGSLLHINVMTQTPIQYQFIFFSIPHKIT